MKRIINLLFVTLITLILTSSCGENGTEGFNETLCEISHKADLLIPSVVNTYDEITNTNFTNQNLVFYNQRTDELFFGDQEPTIPILVNDIIEVGTFIANEWNDSDCEKSANAAESLASLFVNVLDAFGNIEERFELDKAYTPALEAGNFDMVVSAFQINAPGNFGFDFGANTTRTVDEHLYNNNDGGAEEISLRSSQKSIDLSSLNETAKDSPSIEELYPNEKVVNSNQYFKQISVGSTPYNYQKSTLIKKFKSSELSFSF